MRFSLPLLLSIPLFAADIEFKEQFADPASRQSALSDLVPATRDWFFYHTLDHQLAGRHEHAAATLAMWKSAADEKDNKDPVSRDGIETLENRAAILRYDRDPGAAIRELTDRLGLRFDDTRPDARAEEKLPAKIEADDISATAFETDAAVRTDGHPYREFTSSRNLASLEIPDKLAPEHRRWLVEHLDRAHHPGVVPLVAAELGSPDAKPFGKSKLHQQLCLEQLRQLLALKPTLRHNQAFIRLYLTKLKPGSETDFTLDPKAHATHLANCRDFTLTLPAAFNSLKAHVLHHHLRLQRDLGRFPRADFLGYLALPRRAHPLLNDCPKPIREPLVGTDDDFSALTGCAQIGNDSPLIRALLEHFLTTAVDDNPAADFTPFFPAAVFAEIQARAMLLTGADSRRWGGILAPADFQQLKEETSIEFSPGQPLFFAPADPVRLRLDLKHTPQLLVRIHELDLPGYIASHGSEPPNDLELDGLVPHASRSLEFAQPKLVRHRETIDLPELDGRGAWIVEFISRSVASRALIRKGRLVPHASPAADGRIVRVFDESGSILRDADLRLGSRSFRADDQGRIKVPASELTTRRTAVVTAPGSTPVSPGLAAPLTLEALVDDDFSLDASFHVAAEALRADCTAELHLRLRLTKHGHPIPLTRLKDPALTLSASLLGDATVERIIAEDLDLAETITAPFHVPADARALAIRFAASIDSPSTGEPIPLEAERKLEINGIFHTPDITTAFFTPGPDGHILELRGRNGEPIPTRAITLGCYHRDFDKPLELRLRTDPDGRINLGQLNSITSVEARGEGIDSRSYRPADTLRQATLPERFHILAGESLNLPLSSHTGPLDPARYSLLQGTKTPAHDHFDKLAIADGHLVVGPLPPGSHHLLTPDIDCRIHVSAGADHDGLLVSPARVIPRISPPLPRISSITVHDGSLLIQTADSTPDSRLTLIGTRFTPEWPPIESLAGWAAPLPPSLKPGFHGNAFRVGRILDEETRYVLERRARKQFPGSQLPRPGLLLNRFSEADAAALPQLPKQGRDSKKEDSPSRRAREFSAQNTRNEAHPEISLICFDFLAEPPIIRHQLKPGPDGSIRIPLADLPGVRLVTALLGNDSGFADQMAAALDSRPPKLRDRRLLRPLAADKHHLGTRRAEVLAAGTEANIENILNAEWRAFTSLADVHAFLYGASRAESVRDFSFLLAWPDLDEARKLALLSDFACHEFHLFLARKDPDFFAKHVKPGLAGKRQPTFLDDYLLGRDLSAWLRPFAWRRLNAAEKALLAQALPDARDRITTELRQRWDLEAPDPQVETLLFTQTLRGSDLALQDSLGLASNLMPLDSDGASYLLQKLRSIVIPEIDFEDTSVEEAIDFLRQRTAELDTLELDPSRKGLNFVIRKPRLARGADLDDGGLGLGLGSDPGSARISELRLRNVPASTVLKYICDASRLRYKVDDFAVSIVPATETSEDLFTRTFRVPPDFVAGLDYNGGGLGGEIDPFAPDQGGAGMLKPRKSVEELLKDKGVPFPEGASVSYLPGSSTLVVRNSPTNIDLMESLVEASRSSLGSTEPAEAFGFAGGIDAGILPPLTDAKGRQPARPPRPRRRNPEHTRIWHEHNYYRHSGNTDEDLVPLSRFWIDLAAWNGRGRFLSPHFNACTHNGNEALLCLALLDLPFEAAKPEVKVDKLRLRIRAKDPLLLFFKDTRETDQIAADSPLLVRQEFHRFDDRFRTVNGQRRENTLTGPLLAGVPYGVSQVVTNPTGTDRRIDILSQIPAGAIPLNGHKATASTTRMIEPYGVLSLQSAFYFPVPGKFSAYPIHVAETGTIVGHAEARALEVTADPAGRDHRSWPATARDGSPAEVLDHLRECNLGNTNLRLIRWRLRDRDFFLKTAAILRHRLHHSPAVSSFGFHHGDAASIRDYLENSGSVRQLGAWFDSPLIEIRPGVHLRWKTLGFSPLVNPRAHRLGEHNRITHPAAAEHYGQFLDQLAWKPALDADDHLVLTWFLLLQDRVGEALDRFAKVPPPDDAGHLLYDYLHCCTLFYQAKPAEARAIAAAYSQHPLALWRDRFHAVVSQADEIAANKPRETPADPATTAPSLDLILTADGSLTLKHHALKQATLKLYGVDLELLFSRNPFLDQQGELHQALRPNHVIQTPLDPAAATTNVDLPPQFRRGNVLVTAEAANQRIVRALDSRDLILRRHPADRSIEVLAAADKTPLPRCYVKLYAEMADGSTSFYKDGYSDLRGCFDYLSHTTLDPAKVRRLAILVSHPDHGSRTEVFTP